MRWGKREGSEPDSHAALGPGHPFPLAPRPSYILKHLLAPMPLFPLLFQNFLLFLSHLIFFWAVPVFLRNPALTNLRTSEVPLVCCLS